MKFTSLSALMWFAVATAQSSLAQSKRTNIGGVDSVEDIKNEVPGGFVVACHGVSDIEPLVQEVEERGGIVRHKFLSDIFPGFSVLLSNSTFTKEALAQSKSAKDVWAVQMSTPAPALENGTRSVRGTGAETREPRGVKRLPLRRQTSARNLTAPWSHIWTQVDQLHAEGVRGSGIRIAVVDTGVNYTHPALGGCFGDGCRVRVGANFVQDRGSDDPMDCNGHGTKVAGVLAGFSLEDDFVGAAPNATIGAYRVVGCKQEISEDDMIAGWLRAYEDGAQIIVSSSTISGNWAQRPLALVVSKIVAKGVPCVVSIGNEREAGFFGSKNPSTGRGVTAVNSFVEGWEQLEIAPMSSAGPTWELDVKPKVGAPGHDVPAPLQRGGYDVVRGTSFATPLVAGILALMAEVRGTCDPDLLNGLLSSTAVPQREDDSLMTVAQQGGGLVRAWDAAHATTVVEPSSLAFNDTEHRVPAIEMRITNTGQVAVDYVLSSMAATTLYAVENQSGKPQLGAAYGDAWVPEAIPQAVAGINISHTSLRLNAGQSATVSVTAADPHGVALDLDRLPIWSGFISISGSDGRNATVPYLGVAGSLRSMDVFAYRTVEVSKEGASNDGSTLMVPDAVSVTKLNSTNVTNSGQSAGPLDKVNLLINGAIGLGSAQLRADIVPLDTCPTTEAGLEKCMPSSLIVKTNGIQSFGQLPGYPKHFTSRDVNRALLPTVEPWDGSFAPGQYVPPGRYKIVLQALALFGNVSNATDWQTIESPVITVTHNLFDADSEQLSQEYDDIFAPPPAFDTPENAPSESEASSDDINCAVGSICPPEKTPESEISTGISGSHAPGSGPSGSNPSGSNPFGSNPSGSNPSGSNPFGSNPFGSNPFGSNPLGTQ